MCILLIDEKQGPLLEITASDKLFKVSMKISRILDNARDSFPSVFPM